jgi:hypothetical protein
MKSFLHKHGKLFAAVVISLVVATSVIMAQEKYRKAAERGPYRVIMSRPIIGLGFKGDSLYREDEKLSAALNELDVKGFVPIWMQIFAAETKELPREERLLIICRKR